MIFEDLVNIDSATLSVKAIELTRDEIGELVNYLDLTDDKIRYTAFQLLSLRSEKFNDVYPYMKVFIGKLKNANSYQRSLGLMLIAENAKWDNQEIIDNIIDSYLLHIYDDKPITVRQCIQGLIKIIPYHKILLKRIAETLMSLEIYKLRETMQKSILTDILNILVIIRKTETNDKIENYIANALTGGLLDKKAVKLVEKQL